MKIWGLISSEHETRGFEAVIDAQGQVLIQKCGEVMACYDPIDYTLPGLCKETLRRLQEIDEVLTVSVV
ncbi:MAG: hypothetical protein HOC20_05280 [Chloroflexi bacterium]|jgi:hypothetical protein|nr:hypothetical protein [Chloroflexota bacterium]